MTNPALSRILPVLVASALLGKLPEAVLTRLAREGQLKRYPKGEPIYHRGDLGDTLLAVISGGVKLTTLGAGGKEIVLHFHRPGDIFGEIAAFDGRERAASASAFEDTEILLIPMRELLPVLLEHPPAMLGIIQTLCNRLRMGASLIEDSTLMMRGRTARGLLRLMPEHGVAVPDGVSLKLSISQEDLGSYLGLSRANVSRQLGLLRAERVIRISEAQIVVTDVQGLREIAEAAA